MVYIFNFLTGSQCCRNFVFEIRNSFIILDIFDGIMLNFVSMNIMQ